MNIRICVLVLLALVSIASCGDEASITPSNRKPVPEYLGDNTYPDFDRFFGIGDTASVDSGFLLSFGESTFDSLLSTHKQFLSFETVQSYSCGNQYIITHVTTDPGRITIDIDGVQYPKHLFDDAIDHSYVREFFKLETGVYNIEIRYKEDTGSFTLTVTDSSLEVRILSESSFKLQDSLYWRYRPMSCAFVCGMSYQDTTACSRLLDTLLRTVQLKSYAYPSKGVRPYPTGSQGNYISWDAQYFIYDSEADFDRAGELLHSYGQAMWAWNSGNTAFLVNYRGKQYMSWYPR